ncbi:hypothetical protein BC830DRAFT_1118469 [Chytriomyces sp. MP71]|nr:hypothetical protein BC830DRAFT_1118469 [Chytriomyces sp. MP71]
MIATSVAVMIVVKTTVVSTVVERVYQLLLALVLVAVDMKASSTGHLNIKSLRLKVGVPEYSKRRRPMGRWKCPGFVSWRQHGIWL